MISQKGRPRKQPTLVPYDKEDVTAEQIRIARERIKPHLLNFHWIAGHSLEQLLVNVYLQGLTDMAEALVLNGYKPMKEEPVMDYQI